MPETPVQRLRVCNKAGRLRLNVGDKVRCVDANVSQGRLEKDGVYTISVSDTDNTVKISGMDFWWRDDRFVLADETPAVQKPQFKVGDKVRCVKPFTGLRADEVYQVEDVDADGLVKLVGFSVWLEPGRFVLTAPKPKLMLVGPSRCGKDEAGQFLESITGLRFAGTTSKYLSPYVARCLGMNEEECYAKRHEMREAWYHVGRAVRSGDPGILVRESLKHGEIIGGVRDKEEVIAAREMVSLIVWIENERPEKDPTLMFGPECCDIIIPNNGTLEEYHERLRRFANALGIKASK